MIVKYEIPLTVFGKMRFQFDMIIISFNSEDSVSDEVEPNKINISFKTGNYETEQCALISVDRADIEYIIKLFNRQTFKYGIYTKAKQERMESFNDAVNIALSHPDKYSGIRVVETEDGEICTLLE